MKTMYFIVAVVLIAGLTGCGGGSSEPGVIPIHPPTVDVRVETPVPYTYEGYDQAADLVGTQIWRVWGDRPDRPVDLVPVENDAIEITRGTYLGAYTEWSLKALSSWRTDLSVMVGDQLIRTIFVVTERMDPEKLTITIEDTTKLDEVTFDAGELLLGTSKMLVVDWSYQYGYPQYPQVPVFWEVPTGLNIAMSPDSKHVLVTSTCEGTWELTGDVAGKVFTVKFIVPKG